MEQYGLLRVLTGSGDPHVTPPHTGGRPDATERSEPAPAAMDGSLAGSSSAPVLRLPDRRRRMRTMPIQSVPFGHSPRRGIANSADSAGTKAPKAAPPEAPRMATARPYRRRETMVTRTPWKIA